MKLSLWVPAALVALAACQPPLTSTWQLTDFRVLGIKVTTATPDDPTRAEPDRGGSFTLSLATADTMTRADQTLWLVLPVAVSPTELPTLLSMGAGGTSGQPVSPGELNVLIQLCLAGMLPPMQGFECGGGPTATFTVPTTGGSPDSSGREALTVLGYSCAGGTVAAAPAADPNAGGSALPFQCNGAGATGWMFTRTVFVHPPMGDPNPPNHNPSITEVRFGADPNEVAITDDAPPTIPVCATQPQVNASLESSHCPIYHVQVGFGPSDRETYSMTDAVSGAVSNVTEQLTTGYIVSDGSIDGSFRSDSDTDPLSNFDDEFLAPSTPGPIDLYIYVSDGRGGFDWAHRTILVQ